MLPTKNISLALIFTLILSGCATTYTPITNYELKNYETATVISNIPQQEIRLQITPSNSGGAAGAPFGLIGVLIGVAVDASANNNKASKAEESIERFRVALRDEDITGQINLELQSQLSDLSWVKINNFDQTHVAGREFSKLPTANIYRTDVMILVNTDYSITPNFETIELTANYWVYAINKHGKVDTITSTRGGKRKIPKAFYFNEVVYQADIFPAANTKRRLTKHDKDVAMADLDARIENENNRRSREKLKNQRIIELRKLDKHGIKADPSNLDGAMWLNNNAELTRQALLNGSKEIAKLISMDIRGEASDLKSLEIIKSPGIKMYLVSKDELAGREIYRAREGLVPGKLISKTSKHDYLLKIGRQ